MVIELGFSLGKPALIPARAVTNGLLTRSPKPPATPLPRTES